MNPILLTEFKDANRGLLVLQGIYDLVPVILFMIASVILLRELYSKMVKGCYVLLAGGSIMVFVSGALKALHKILMGAFQIDYIILDKQFTPGESIGFLLLFVSLIGMFTSHNTDHIDEKKTSAAAFILPSFLFILEESVQYGDSGLPVFTNLWPFLSLMIIGAAGYLILLAVISFKMKKKAEMILFILSVLFMVGMGYLSTKRGFEGAWLQITCNVCYQTCFLAGCILLKKHGLSQARLFKNQN